MSNYDSYAFPNRSLCSILEDVRKAHKHHNYSYLAGLIEELQYAGNRMEAALADQKDLMELKKERSKLRSEVNDLKQAVEKLKNQIGKKRRITTKE